MKLRIARKIFAAIGGVRDGAYSEAQKIRALNRVDRMQSMKESNSFFMELVCNQMTVLDRASILPKDMALRLLMKHEEEDWDKTAEQIVRRNKTDL